MEVKNNILITGGLGNLGSWLSECFFQNDYNLFVTTREKAKFKHPYNEIICDLTDRNSLAVLEDYTFDYVIHLASYNEYFEQHYFTKALKINTEGTFNLIQALKKSSVKGFVYFSTAHVYGTLKGEITEKTVPNPLNDYASTHLFAEYITKQYCEQYHFPYTIFRLSNSYGAPKFINNSKWYLLLNDLCKQAVENRKIVLNTNGKAYRDFIWMGDVATICLAFIKNNLFQDNVLNLSSAKSIRIYEIAKKVKFEFEKKFKEEIEILINENDSNTYFDYRLNNKNLKKEIQFKFQNKFKDEVQKIFSHIALIDANKI